jgi:hypothetical protein
MRSSGNHDAVTAGELVGADSVRALTPRSVWKYWLLGRFATAEGATSGMGRLRFEHPHWARPSGSPTVGIRQILETVIGESELVIVGGVESSLDGWPL